MLQNRAARTPEQAEGRASMLRKAARFPVSRNLEPSYDQWQVGCSSEERFAVSAKMVGFLCFCFKHQLEGTCDIPQEAINNSKVPKPKRAVFVEPDFGTVPNLQHGLCGPIGSESGVHAAHSCRASPGIEPN